MKKYTHCGAFPVGRLLIIATILALATGCVAGRPHSGVAMLEMVDQEGSATPKASSHLEGSEACSYNILGIVSYGDSSISAARGNNKTRPIAEVKRKIFGLNPWFYPIFAKSCLTVVFADEPVAVVTANKP